MRVSGMQSPQCRLEGTVVSIIIVFVLDFFVLVFVNENHTEVMWVFVPHGRTDGRPLYIP